MNPPILGFALLVLAGTSAPTAAQPCMLVSGRLARGTSSQHWSDTDDNHVRSTSIRWKRGNCELRIDASGEFVVKPDLSGFTSVDDYIELEERDGEHRRKVRVTGGSRGLAYEWSLDGKAGFDVDRERWLADILVAVERRTALFARTRVPLLIKQRGPDAVLDETALMDGDYAKRQYLTLLVATASLTDAQADRLLRQVADSMASDYERSEVVRAVAAKVPMNDRLARQVIHVAEEMSSDYEKRRTLSAGLESATSPVSRTAFFTAASSMSSSYEIAELLIAAQKRSFVDSLSADAYFKAVAKVTSDYERRRTLSALLQLRPDSPAILAGVLRASSSIASDYELASLLVEFAKVTPVRGELRDLYLKATRSISSDFEYRRALTALLEQDRRI